MFDIHLSHGRWSFSDNEPLGKRGGFGEVFEGRSSDGTPVAIKRFHKDWGTTPRECDIVSLFIGKSFTHLIPIYDAGINEKDGKYYIVMAKAEHTLESQILNSGRPESEAAIFCRDIVDGLKELSHLRVVHRDLKPGNVLHHAGLWKLADFGISRDISKSTSTNTLMVYLTPEYGAPEQWNGDKVSTATDVYALGCIAYELFTGKPPFSGPDFREQHLHTHPPPISASNSYIRLVTGCLAKEQEMRPSLDSMAALLQQVISPIENREDDLLAKVGVILAEEAAVQEAQAAKQRDEHQKREALAEGASQLLLEIRKTLIASIYDRAPTVKDDQKCGVYRLGNGYLRFDLKFRLIEKGVFAQSGWDVIAGAYISTIQDRKEYEGRSANLWFMKMKPEEHYRWREVAYMSSPAISSHRAVDPFGWDNQGGLQHADEAASNVMGAYQHATTPKTIDGEDVNSFCRRWRDYFALAAQNKLERPSVLPEG